MAERKPQKTPRGLGTSGRALWTAVLDDFELTEHESAVLGEACRTADAIDLLQAVVDDEGPMSTTSQGSRVHPALVELRQQRIALARLFAAMHIPTGDEEGRTQHRGARGVYGIRGAV